MTQPLWHPSEHQRKRTAIEQFRRWLEEKFQLSLPDYPALHRWSIEQPELFWQTVWQFTHVVGDLPETSQPGTSARRPGFFEDLAEDQAKALTQLAASWFPDARLNFAENLLQRRDQHPALIFHREDGERRQISYQALYQQVCGLARALQRQGIQPGDVIAGYLPNCIETVVAALATSAIGAIWTSCSPDFGSKGVLDRFGQTQPKLLFSVDGYLYNGKQIEMLPRLVELTGQLPSLQQLVVIPYLSENSSLPVGAISYRDFLAASGLAERGMAATARNTFEFQRWPFAHPLYLLYSSGTTGVPKCILHGAGGTLLQHRKEHRLHCDLDSDDVLFYFTTCGWMMWNWLISGLASGATLVLYDGNPLCRPEILWQIAEREKISVFGTSAKYLSALEKSGYRPRSRCDLSALRMLLSTGSPLLEQGFDFVYQQISDQICLASISGGTDIISCFALGNPALPVWRGELQCIGLGMDVAVYNSLGEPVQGQKGELVCRSPFPSMPLGFWNDAYGGRYHKAYYQRFDNVWAHGDYALLTEHQGMIFYGRADATLNPGGVRIGTAEIYRPVEKLEQVLDCLAVGQKSHEDERVVLFVVLREGMTLNDELIRQICAQIRADTTPRHVPAKVIQVPQLPRTLSGKLAEMAVRQVIHGETVENRDALANPESLALFADLEQLR